MYKCVVFFSDLHDKSFEYRPGDIFPRSGLKVSPERLEELSTDKNRRGKPLIEKVEETETEKVPELKDAIVETQIVDTPKAAKPKRGRKKKNAD
jgi:hypothetical protein